MKVCGVIAEYDPFHRGHERQLLLARQRTGADYILCVMSGSFTQRGMPALLPAHARAEMALRCGADAVLQLPYAFSVREAEYFALGGVHILHALHCVTHLSFGCETEDISLLERAAEEGENPSQKMVEELKKGLEAGLSFAAAEGRALARCLGVPEKAFNAPNTALALAYLRALIRLKSDLRPVPILRPQDYRAAEVEEWPSATAVRGAILRGDWARVEKAVPAAALPVLRRAVSEGMCDPGSVDAPLRHTLLLASGEKIARWPGVDEGMEARIQRAAAKAREREELIFQVKTRRYTYGRISRALCHGMMDVEKSDLPPLPDHARILGFRESARPLLRRMQDSGFPLISRPAQEPCMALDVRADEVWRVLAGLPLGDTYRRAPVILPSGKDE